MSVCGSSIAETASLDSPLPSIGDTSCHGTWGSCSVNDRSNEVNSCMENDKKKPKDSATAFHEESKRLVAEMEHQEPKYRGNDDETGSDTVKSDDVAGSMDDLPDLSIKESLEDDEICRTPHDLSNDKRRKTDKEKALLGTGKEEEDDDYNHLIEQTKYASITEQNLRHLNEVNDEQDKAERSQNDINLNGTLAPTQRIPPMLPKFLDQVSQERKSDPNTVINPYQST